MKSNSRPEPEMFTFSRDDIRASDRKPLNPYGAGTKPMPHSKSSPELRAQQTKPTPSFRPLILSDELTIDTSPASKEEYGNRYSAAKIQALRNKEYGDRCSAATIQALRDAEHRIKHPEVYQESKICEDDFPPLPSSRQTPASVTENFQSIDSDDDEDEMNYVYHVQFSPLSITKENDDNRAKSCSPNDLQPVQTGPRQGSNFQISRRLSQTPPPPSLNAVDGDSLKLQVEIMKLELEMHKVKDEIRRASINSSPFFFMPGSHPRLPTLSAISQGNRTSLDRFRKVVQESGGAVKLPTFSRNGKSNS